MKPIICPECLSQLEQDMSKSELNGTEEDVFDEKLEENSVKTFSNWMSYGQHILKEHPLSSRVNWVIDCVAQEIKKYEGKGLPKSLAILETLIKNGNPELKKTPEIEDEIKPEDDWLTQLNALHGIKKEPVVEPVITIANKPKKKSYTKYIFIGISILAACLSFVSFGTLKIPALGLGFLVVTAVCLVAAFLIKPKK